MKLSLPATAQTASAPLNPIRTLSSLLLLTLVGTTWIAEPVRGQEPSSAVPEIHQTEYPRYALTLTNTFLIFDGTVKSDVNQVADTGTRIDMHRDLGFDMTKLDTSILFETELTPSDRLGFRYGLLRAEARNNIRRDLYFDHVTYATGNKLNSELLFRKIGIKYDRAVLTNDSWKLWLGLGVDELHVRVRIHDFENNISDVEDIETTIDIYAHLAISRRLKDDLYLHLDISRSIPLDIGNVEHNSFYLDLNIEYRRFENVSFLVGYSIKNIDITDNEEDAPGTNLYKINGRGLSMGVKYTF
jgi:hypothetical protein